METMTRTISDKKKSSTAAVWRNLFGLTILFALGGFGSIAHAEGGSVLYLYQQIRIAGEAERVLIPVAENSLRGEVTAETIEAAFERLRRAKPPTYGNSYAQVSGRLPNNARVEVHIARGQEEYAPIIIAEAVYTLTEFGIDEIFFPGHAEGGLTRSDIPFAAYTLTVPLWNVVPPGRVTTAQVRMPDGALLPVSEVNDRWRNDRESIVDEVYSYLNSEVDHTVRFVVRMLPELGDLRIDEVTPLLEHGNSQVRLATLNLMEGRENEEVVLDAVVAALGEESSLTLGREMAEFLGRSNQARYSVEEPFFLIRRGEDEEAVEATTALSNFSGDERVVEMLTELLRDERQEVAMASAESLRELESHSARIAALADDEVNAEVREKLATDLSAESNGAPERLVGLTYLARIRTEGHASRTIATIASLPIDEARQTVESFLSDESRSRRLAATGALQERNDVTSAAALLTAAQNQPEATEMEAAAYAIMVSQPLATIVEQTEASSAEVQQIAFQAVGERAAGEGVSGDVMATIEAGTNHRSPAIRGASARALGEIGGDNALEILGGMTGDSSPVVRRDVALALGNFPGDAFADTLVEYLDDGDARVVAAAIDAMEQRGDNQALVRIREMIRHDEAVIRASSVRAVTTFLNQTDPNTVRQHIALLSGFINDPDINVRVVVLEQLGRFEEESAVINIARLVDDADNTAVRVAAIRALGSTGHDSARRLLVSRLDDRNPEVRREAIDSLTRLQGSAARNVLELRMEEEEDPEVRELLEVTLERI